MAPGYRVLMAFGASPQDGYAAVADHEDITAYVKSVTIQRGRNQDLDRIEASTCTLELDNSDGRFTPENTAGAYYPDVLPFAQVYVQWQDSLSAYHGLFRGFVERWSPVWYQRIGGTCTVECVDVFRILQLNTIDVSTGTTGAFTLGTAALGDASSAKVFRYVDESIGARIAAVLVNVGTPFTQDISTAGFTITDANVDPNALEYIKAIAVLDAGLFYVDGDGVITFLSHADVDAMTERVVAQADIGDTGGQIPYKALSLSMDEQIIINRVSGANVDATAITAQEDADSQALYMPRPLDLGTTDLVSVADVVTRARLELVRRKDARLRVDAISFELLDADVDAESLLGLDLSHRVSITRTPDQGAALASAYLVQGVQHSIQPATWIMGLSVAGTPDVFTLGLAVLGESAL